MNTNRYAAVDGLRALAALMVMHGHILCALYRYPYPAWTWFWFNGDICVIYFLAISGFCLALPVIKHDLVIPSIWTYLARRAARILPPFWAAIGAGFVVFIITRGFVPIESPAILRNFAWMIHDVQRTSDPINGPLWTIGVEWRCYLLLPVIVLAWRRFGYRKTFSVVTVLTLLFWFFLERTKLVYAHSLFLIVFMLGIGAAYIAAGRTPSLQSWRALPWKGIAIGTNLFLFAYHLYQFSWPREWHTQYTGLFYTLLIGFAAFTTLIVVGSGDTWASRILGWKPLSGVGQWSYSLYLLHAPVFFLMYPVFTSGQTSSIWTPYVRALVIFVPATLPLCYMFYLIIEKPAIALSAKVATLHWPRILLPGVLRPVATPPKDETATVVEKVPG